MRGTIRHVSKFPPSTSGIGLYAALFETTFPPTIRVQRATFGPDPRTTQRLRASLHGLAQGLRGTAGADVLHVEIGGRSLAEFYFVVGTLLRRSRPWTVLTCHDVPSLAGATMLFTVLDRRGLRRVGMWLSSRLGAAVERWVMRESDSVFALTASGASEMAGRYGRSVHHLGHVVAEEPLPPRKDPLVLLPGYVSLQCPVAEIVRVVAEAPATSRGPWRVLVGAADQAHVERELRAVGPARRSLVEIQGQVSESELVASYLRAAVVLRVGSGHAATNHFAASGPLSLALACGCRVLTDDPRPGVTELADAALLCQTPSPLDALVGVLAEAAAADLAPEPTDRVGQLYGPAATHRRYIDALRDDAVQAGH